MKEDIERRRMEAAEKRMKNINITSTDGDDPFNPLNPISPTFKVTVNIFIFVKGKFTQKGKFAVTYLLTIQ